MVVITHYNWSDDVRLKFLFPYWIDMAVPTFMILSGYVMSMSYKRRSAESFRQMYSYEHILKSIVRYTVPFVVAHIARTSLLLVSDFIDNQVISASTLRYFLTGFINGGGGPGSYYYPVMIQFVFTIPVIYTLIRKYARVGVLICFAINAGYEVIKTAFEMNEECYRLLIFRYVFAIAIGVYFELYSFKTTKKTLVVCALGAVYIWLVNYTAYTPIVLTYWTGTSFLSVLYIAPIIGLLLSFFGNKQFKMLRPIRCVGKASYNIFLTQMVYYYIDGGIEKIIGNYVMHLILNLVICIVIGIVFYYIEQRITRKIYSATLGGVSKSKGYLIRLYRKVNRNIAYR